MKVLSYFVLLLSLITMIVGCHNLIQMARFIESKSGAFGFKPLWAEGSYFTDSIGLEYRRKAVIWFSLAAVLMLVFALAISTLPNFEL